MLIIGLVAQIADGLDLREEERLGKGCTWLTEELVQSILKSFEVFECHQKRGALLSVVQHSIA